MWDTARPTQTAEWLCTKCGVTNRKQLPPRADDGHDRCVHCRLKHVIGRGTTPVRWNAKAE
jgi:hypothetical protein